MKICPITYEEINPNERYSLHGLHLLSPKLGHLQDFPFSAEEQRREAEVYSSKLSIQGVQSKLSAALNIKKEVFEIVERNGRYILKSQSERFQFLPENEHLTMRLASQVGIEVPLHGLIYSKDGSFTYFIRRFDRKGQKSKIHVEDFAQLCGESRETKYRSSMEKVAAVLEKYCTFPAIEKLKLFQRTLFSFLIGNEDMHLKNFSLMIRDDRVELSPAYDLINSTIVLTSPTEEIALPLAGKKKNLTRNDIFNYYARERLGISETALKKVTTDFTSVIPQWRSLVERSFLIESLKEKYLFVLNDRARRLQLASG